MENYNNYDELESYGGLGHMAEFRKAVNEDNVNKVMRAQFDLIKKQQQEIIEQSKYREESRRSSKRTFNFAIAGIVIALLTLIATIIGWFI